MKIWSKLERFRWFWAKIREKFYRFNVHLNFCVPVRRKPRPGFPPSWNSPRLHGGTTPPYIISITIFCEILKQMTGINAILMVLSRKSLKFIDLVKLNRLNYLFVVSRGRLLGVVTVHAVRFEKHLKPVFNFQTHFWATF